MTTTPKTEPKQITSPNPKKRLLIIAASISGGILITLGILMGWYWNFLNTYEEKFYPGITIGDIDVSGMTYMEARDAFDSRLQPIEDEGIAVVYTNAPKEVETLPAVVVLPTIPPASSDGVEQKIYTTDIDAALKEAFAIGREDSFWTRMKRQYSAAHAGRILTVPYSFDRSIVQTLLDDAFTEYENPATNANIAIDENGDVSTVEEKSGEAFDDEAIMNTVEDQLVHFNTNPIEIDVTADEPEITVADVEKNIPLIESYLSLAPLTLQWEDQSWEYDRIALGSWMSFESGDFSISPELLDESLTEPKEQINIAVKEARWQVQSSDGEKVDSLTELQPSEEGKEINMEETAKHIDAWLKLESEKKSTDTAEPIELAVDITKPEFTPDNIEEMGIKEKIGTGYSNMAGSPYNRQQNISRGIELLNGLLVAPNEEFCLNAALKPYTTDNGYKAELVIKGNETIPEVGGGLCQVGTTSFRAALSSGLDITARQNHSYQVSYYNDPRNGNPGTDATIYDPWPDFCFINDTPAYLLMQTRLDGTALYFDYFGTDDGREASYSEPTVSNWVSPPPVKEIPTDDLAPGQRRCTESAHNGVSAEFTYSVDYSDGERHEEIFKSIYKPWQAVCQVGKEKEEEKPAEEKKDEPPKEEEKKKSE